MSHKTPLTLTHYTNKQGYDAILASKKIRASTISGIKNTHYGKGAYFTPIGPTEIGILGPYDFTRRTFNDVTPYAVDRLQYFITVKVDVNWHPMVAFEPKTGHHIDDIWVIPGVSDINIAGHILFHGKTSIGHAIDQIKNQQTAARDYAFKLTEEHKARKAKPHEHHDPPPRKTPFVFIDGRTVKRPEGWNEDSW